MHTLRLVVNLRPDSASGQARATENEIVPPLREREGSRDVVASMPEGAEQCRRAGRQGGVEAPDNVIVGLPKVETFEASASTFREIAAKAA